MLLLASESAVKARNVIDVARELSLSFGYFTDAVDLDRQLRGDMRRIVLLLEDDLSVGKVAVLQRAAARGPFGLVVAADQDTLKQKLGQVPWDELSHLPNLQWLTPGFRRHHFRRAARECRRHLLKVSPEDLRNAMLRQEFCLRYQPKVMRSDTAEWKTTEAEALLRWQHPIHGSIGPLEFLPELEAFDLMPAVSEYVLREAARQLVEWRKQGLTLNSCINLASSQLNNQGLADESARIVRAFGLDCSSFTFEVIEQDIANSDAPHLKVLNELREHGFRVSLDDFGIAAASLGTLEALPVDEIKIHAAALKRARKSDVAQKVLAAVTGLAHNLGISVCAEGVEDQETYEFLATIECDKLQGYLISEAVMPDLIQAGYSADEVEVHAVA